jgi:glutamate 5-kinase
MVARNASLLRPGILTVDGEFDAGVVVSVCDEQGVEFARGRCDLSSEGIRGGDATRKPVVHRDHLVVLEGGEP